MKKGTLASFLIRNSAYYIGIIYVRVCFEEHYAQIMKEEQVENTEIDPIVWELYAIIQERGPKYCAKKCIDLLDECEEYILKNVSRDDWRPLKSFEGRNGAEPATFATTVIVSLVLSCLRNIKDVVSFDEYQAHYSSVPIFQLLMYDELNDAVSQLDEMDKLIIILFYYDGYSAEEIAAMLNCSMGELERIVNEKFSYIAEQLSTSVSELIDTMKITPKKFASYQGNTSKQIHKKIENAKNRLKSVLEGI